MKDSSWRWIRMGPYELPKWWLPKQSIEETHVHKGEEGNRETPSHRCKPTTNSGPGIAKFKPKEGLGIALSQPLLLPGGWARAFKRARSRMLLVWKNDHTDADLCKSRCKAEEMGMLGNSAEAVSSSGKWSWSKSTDKCPEASSQMLLHDPTKAAADWDDSL